VKLDGFFNGRIFDLCIVLGVLFVMLPTPTHVSKKSRAVNCSFR
jgi:hypothetical protein